MVNCLNVKQTKTRIAVLWAMEMVKEGNPAVLEIVENIKVIVTKSFA